MMRGRRGGWLLAAVGGFLLAGCGPRESSAGDGAEAAKGDAPVIFKAGRGLQLTPAVIKGLGLTTAEVAEHPLAFQLLLTAQVFDAGPPARATAFVNPAEADALAQRPFAGARLLQVSRAAEAATRQVEAIFALTEPGHTPGEFVRLTLQAPAAPVLAVPRSAVLDRVAGSCVFVVNGGSFLRTAVKTGARDEAWVEITDGLYEGDRVVTAAVEKLSLIELSFTNGGDDD